MFSCKKEVAMRWVKTHTYQVQTATTWIVLFIILSVPCIYSPLPLASSASPSPLPRIPRYLHQKSRCILLMCPPPVQKDTMRHIMLRLPPSWKFKYRGREWNRHPGLFYAVWLRIPTKVVQGTYNEGAARHCMSKSSQNRKRRTEHGHAKVPRK